MKTFKSILFQASALAILLLTSCAGTAPSAKFTQRLSADSILTAKDAVDVKVKAASGVTLAPHKIQRVEHLLTKKVSEKKHKNATNREPKSFDTVVTLTQYDEGNAFARAMLAGLGQMKIKSRVALYERSPRRKVGEFDLDKTFAWGGLYGGMTSMEDVEDGFTDGVANALTAKP